MADANKSKPTPVHNKPIEPTDSPGEAPKPMAKSRAKLSSWPRHLSWFTLLLVFLNATLGVFAWTHLKHQLTLAEQTRLAMGSRIDDLDPTPALEQLTKTLNSETTNLRERIEIQQHQQRSLRAAVVKTHGLASRTQRGWVIAEALYLVELAQHKLEFMRDLDGAVAALEAADQRVRTLDDPSFSYIHTVLNTDIKNLKAFPRPNLSAISRKLELIINQHVPMLIEKPYHQQSRSLPLRSTSQANTDQSTGEEGLLVDLLKELNKHLIIRRHDQPLQPIPDKRMQLYHYQLLRLKLEAARLAILREDEVEFHHQLQSALDWIGMHYSAVNAKPLTEKLEGLKTIKIRPKLPDASHSLHMLLELSKTKGLSNEDA